MNLKQLKHDLDLSEEISETLSNHGIDYDCWYSDEQSLSNITIEWAGKRHRIAVGLHNADYDTLIRSIPTKQNIYQLIKKLAEGNND